jgi:putative sugar O-methyltransferase
MIYLNTSAIDYLYSKFYLEDLNASSHWKQMHASLKLNEGKKLSGMRGFGNFSHRYNFLKHLGHIVLRQRLMKIGKKFKFFKEIFNQAKKICNRQARVIDQDMLRQIITVAYLFDKLKSSYFESTKGNILVIGDGWGSLTSLLLAFTSFRIVLINLNKTLLVDLLYIQKAFPDLNYCYVEDSNSLEIAMSDKSVRLITLTAENYQLLKNIPINLAINIASMQEMTYKSIYGYFDVLRASPSRMTYLYCCNRHSKRLPDGSLINFDNYGWLNSDENLEFSECPWHKEYYKFLPPFYKKFDGVLMHKLCRLTKTF